MIVITNIEYILTDRDPFFISDKKHTTTEPAYVFSEAVFGTPICLLDQKKIKIGVTKKVREKFGFLLNIDRHEDPQRLREVVRDLCDEISTLKEENKMLTECLDNYKSIFIEK